MTYYSQIHPWCIIRCLPNAQTAIIQRFRRRSDAEVYLQALRRLEPQATFAIVFDPTDLPFEIAPSEFGRSRLGEFLREND